MIDIVLTNDAPLPIGPYEQAIASGDLIFTSMQLPLTSKGESTTGLVLEEQALQLFHNINAIVTSAGGTRETIVKTTLYLTNLDHMATINPFYDAFFKDIKPARTVLGVSSLPQNYEIAMDAIAIRHSK